MKTFIFTILISLFISISVYSNNVQVELDKLSHSLSNIINANDTKIALQYAKRSVAALDNHAMKDIVKSQRREALGSIYMYYGFLTRHDKDPDDAIKAFTRALQIRVDPYSNKYLATLYKKKYNESVLKNDMAQEKYYGQIIYQHLDEYIQISGTKDKVWQKRRDYFKYYLDDAKTKVANNR